MAALAAFALTCLTACSQSAAIPPRRSFGHTIQAHALAGTILRVVKGQASGDLRITEESGPDAPGPPYPECLTGHSARQRVVNFDLNWAGINYGEAGAAPAVTVTIAGPDGSVLIANQPQENPPDLCRTVRAFVLGAQGKGWQLVYGLALKEPSHARLNYLWITVDGHVKKLRLSPVCNRASCFQANPPVGWQAGTSYSPTLTI